MLETRRPVVCGDTDEKPSLKALVWSAGKCSSSDEAILGRLGTGTRSWGMHNLDIACQVRSCGVSICISPLFYLSRDLLHSYIFQIRLPLASCFAL